MKSPLKVLMFGWEFPPYKSGGLGTACYDLTKGLSKHGVKVTFVMPISPDGKAKHVNLISAYKGVKISQVKSTMGAYMSEHDYARYYQGEAAKEVYGRNLFEEVKRYAKAAAQIARTEEHDVIHVHDWMTYEAGINAKRISKRPLVAHIHATEFDRTGGNPNPHISHIEYTGLMAADRVIANSNYTKKNVINAYGIPEHKIDAVYWGIDDAPPIKYEKPVQDNVVLFLGRITIQKGPDYFIEAAKKVLDHEPNTTFIIAGDGDMLPRIISRAAELGITDKVIFTGKLQGDEVHKAFQAADLYVMPSTSEPFGLVALESLKNGTPVIISKQSGVSEVLKHALKVDFWDINELANKIVGVLRYTALKEELTKNSIEEVKQHDIMKPAKEVIQIYKKVIG